MALGLLSLLLAAGVASAAPAATDGGYLNIPDSAFKYWDMPTAFSGPCDVSTGPDNLIYVQELLANKIVRFNQHTEEFTEYDIPFTVPGLPDASIPLPGNAKAFLLTCAIRTGYDGHMYFSNGNHNQLIRHNVSTGEVKVYTPQGLLQPIGNLEPLNDLTTTPHGVFFSQTTANVLTRFDYATQRFTNFPLPTPLAVPLGMYYSATDGGVWFLEFGASKVGRFDPGRETFEEFPLPAGVLQPVVMRAETHNDDGSVTLWFACVTSSAIVGINTRTREFSVFTEPNGPTLTVEVGQDQRDNVWATHLLQNTLGILNPRTGVVSTVKDPGTINAPIVSLPATGGSGIVGRTVGQPPGQGDVDAAGNAIWYTRFVANKLIRLDLTNVVVP